MSKTDLMWLFHDFEEHLIFITSNSERLTSEKFVFLSKIYQVGVSRFFSPRVS